ncbi:MAG: amidase [Alphaproteobacteria bacterium]|nr:amidase [Alphaproteobacteria bacterium]
MTETSDLTDLTAIEGAQAIGAGGLTSEQWVAACLSRIAETEDSIQAWAFLDLDLALAQARDADRRQAEGAVLGPLHGVPVAVKDIFDTADMPTENGSPIHAGRRPVEDAAAVARLRDAGAVIVGKTVTTEFALFTPGKTRNPHDPSRTPGGSSSGSAAAVASHMVPLAIGSQTAGSVIRPASFCGVFGFKPSHGSISRHGVLVLSATLDHVGTFARDLDDLALITRILGGADPRDPDTANAIVPDFDSQNSGRARRLAFLRAPVWDRLESGAAAQFESLVGEMGASVVAVEPPAGFADILDLQSIVMESDVARHRAEDFATAAELISPRLTEIIERGARTDQAVFEDALVRRSRLRDDVDRLLGDFDAIVTASSSGEAPVGLDSTGDPSFAVPWTFLGLPAISLPMLRGPNGLPVGVQLVGPSGGDGELLATARWLVAHGAGSVTLR